MFGQISLRHSFLKLSLCLIVSCLPLVAMAQFPFVSQEEAASQLRQQLSISEAQGKAFDEAMAQINVLREQFRAEVSHAAGGQGVDLQTLLQLSDALQHRSEALLRNVLSEPQLRLYREMSAPQSMSMQR